MTRFAAILLSVAALSLGGIACDSPSEGDANADALDFHFESFEVPASPPTEGGSGGAHFQVIVLPPLTPTTEP